MTGVRAWQGGRARCIVPLRRKDGGAAGERIWQAETEVAVEQDVFVRLHAREGEERGVEEALHEVAGPTREEVSSSIAQSC